MFRSESLSPSHVRRGPPLQADQTSIVGSNPQVMIPVFTKVLNPAFAQFPASLALDRNKSNPIKSIESGLGS